MCTFPFRLVYECMYFKYILKTILNPNTDTRCPRYGTQVKLSPQQTAQASRSPSTTTPTWVLRKTQSVSLPCSVLSVFSTIVVLVGRWSLPIPSVTSVSYFYKKRCKMPIFGQELIALRPFYTII